MDLLCHSFFLYSKYTLYLSVLVLERKYWFCGTVYSVLSSFLFGMLNFDILYVAERREL